MNETCNNCGVERTKDDFDYRPIQYSLNAKLGWYRENGMVLCGDCTESLIAGANR